MSPSLSISRRAHRKGFSLPEVLIALALVSLVVIGTYMLALASHRTMFIGTQKLRINRDIRTFTNEMTNEARNANHFYIYPSFASGSRDSASDRQRRGKTGDLLVLIYQEPFPNLEDPEHITRIVGYFRSDDGTGEGPVRKFVVNYTPATYPDARSTPIESLIPAESLASDFEQVVELSRGLANNQLFYNYEERSIMVKGEIIHGSEYKRITDTYNFTVSPRG